jgi:hypothetical protein
MASCRLTKYLDFSACHIGSSMSRLLISLLSLYKEVPQLNSFNEDYLEGTPQHLLGSTIASVLSAISEHIKISNDIDTNSVFVKVIYELLPNANQNYLILDAVGSFFTALDKVQPQHQIDTIYKSVKEYLMSNSQNLRSAALRVLVQFENLAHRCGNLPDLRGFGQVFEPLFNIENMKNDVSNIRSKTMHMKKLEQLFLIGGLDGIYEDAIIMAFLGYLTIQFTPLWQSSCQMLSVMANNSSEKFWDVFYPYFQKSQGANVSEIVLFSVTTNVKSDLADDALYESVFSNRKVYAFSLQVRKIL